MALVVVACCGTAFAADCSLSEAQAAKAATEGENMATEHGSYLVRPWVLHESADPLRAQPDLPGIDAVIVETPYERVRYNAYLTRLQGFHVTTAEVQQWRRESAGHLGFIVYAHSADEKQEKFLAQFHPATVMLRSGSTLAPAERAIFGPASDFFDVGSFREERMVGSLTYRFADAPGAAGCDYVGTLRFSDGSGDAYAYPFDLRLFR
jgi:hypothetical protein